MRWEGTLDESGPGLSFAAYGRAVGVSADVVAGYAKGWVTLQDENLAAARISLTDARRLNHMKEDRGAAFLALSRVEGRSLSKLEGDPGFRAAADDIKAEIELERETQLEAGITAEDFDVNQRADIALEAAERRKQVSEIVRRGPAFWESSVEIDLTLGIAGASFEESVQAGAASEGEAVIIFGRGLDDCGDPEVWDQTIAAATEGAVSLPDSLIPTYDTLCAALEPAPDLCSQDNA